MDSITVEFQRFGDATGVLRTSDRYLRTVGTSAPAEEVRFELEQAVLIKGMSTLDYSRFRGTADGDAIRSVAARFLSDIEPYLRRFLPTGPPGSHAGGRYQVEVVTRALELAQLPFEVLSTPDVIVTRRIRQPWPPPPVVRSSVPKVLFAWAAPRLNPSLQRRMKVPAERHLELLEELLRDWGGVKGNAVVPIPNATRDKLAAALAPKDHGFTHVHLLAHGVGPASGSVDPTLPIDLSEKAEPSTFLALENADGTIDRCSPARMAEVFLPDVPRPASFSIATCHSGEVASIESGGTLAHVLHAAGVPVVLASQLALTQAGSDELIRTFLAKVIDGEDPRLAIGACREALARNEEQTYYDRVALVGYIHIDAELGGLPDRKFEVALSRLEAASKYADKRVEEALPRMQDTEKGLSQEQEREAEEIAGRFASVRERLEALEPDASLTKAQREELHGLQASSLKREAEAAWNLSQVLSGRDAKAWCRRSRDALGCAAEAYARAANTSRDHHWTWVQWLVHQAIVRGSLDGLEDDWVVAKAAAQDAALREAPASADVDERRAQQEDAIWARGSLMELSLLSPLVRRGDDLSPAKKHLEELVKGSRALGIDDTIDSTLKQLSRYDTWWGADPHWPLPKEIVHRAKELYTHLETLGSEGKEN